MLAGAAVAAMAVAGQALAQKPAGLPNNYPNKPVKVVIGASPGGGTDILGRLVFKHLGDAWNHPFVIENDVSVMGSALALDKVAKAAPDGYTHNVVSGSTYIGASVVHKIPKNLLKAVDPVAQFTIQPFVLVVTKSLPVNSVPELIAYAKQNPGKLNYASSGLGGSAYLAAEYLKHEAGGLQIQHIPYKGIGPAYVDLIAGRTQLSFGTTVSAVPHVQKGALRILATTGPKRLPNMPDVPTMSEFIPGFEYISFFGVVGPAGMPRQVVLALNKAVNDVLSKPEVQKPLEADGSMVERTTPEGFQKELAGFVARVEKLVRDAKLNLKPEA
jgi:tripartite-type tricarboxylate transporter receptor subunit TctC